MDMYKNVNKIIMNHASNLILQRLELKNGSIRLNIRILVRMDLHISCLVQILNIYIYRPIHIYIYCGV
jgi:hypothetical protein